jgi:hypothetical protein
MWFKTRVGICSLADPSEIRAQKSKKGDFWFIYAQHKAVPQMTVRSLFGRSASLSSPAIHLAVFTDSPTVSGAIAECMARIEDAIRTKADLCDLSQSGDAQAWTKTCTQIQWRSK